MKSVVYLFLVYVGVCVLGTALCAGVFMFCSDLTMCVVGQKFPIVSFNFFMKGIFYSFPAVCAFSLCAMVFSSIRHRIGKIVTFILFLVLGLASWGFLIPYSLNLSMKYIDSFNEGSQSRMISEGFFREERNGIFYYSKINGTKGDGFMIDNAGVPSVFFNEDVVQSRIGYADSLVKEEVQVPSLLSEPLRAYESLMIRAKEDLFMGGNGIILYASFALAMLSVFVLCGASSWRLLNVFLIIVGEIVVAVGNYILSSGQLSLPYFSMENWTLIANLCVSSILILLGIISAILNYRKSKRQKN